MTIQSRVGGDEAASVESSPPGIRSFGQQIGFGIPSFPVVIRNQFRPVEPLLIFRLRIHKNESLDECTGNRVSIAGADQPEYNGWVQITGVIDADTFTYTVSDSAAATATGDDIRVHLLGDDQVKTTYDRRGRTVTATDQRGVEHTFTFDSAGRLSDDTVTDLGSSGIVDDAVRAIVTTYDDIGRLETVTSYDHPTTRENGNIVNQVQYTYGGWGNLIQEHQEHDGVVDNDTLHVDYTYADGASGGVAKYVRLDKLIYPNSADPPNGREVNYDYGTAGGTDDVMSRLAAIKDDGGTPVLASYEYLGAGTVVEENYEQPDVKLDYTGTSHSYSGFDRFGRVVDHLWRDYGASADADRFLYGYDRASNRTWKENDVAANLGTPIHLDELYDYDDVYQLIAADRGDLNSGKNGFEAETEKFAQDWTLEATGNWKGFNEDNDGNGTNELEQTRAHNKANETGTISEGQGQTAWADPVHDAAGNMTTMPKPSDLANSISAKYDAWNRLVEVKDGIHVVAEFEYDGTGRRVLKIYDSQSPGSPNGVDACEHYLHSGQQVIETRQDDLEGGEAPVADSIQPTYQNVWSPRYIDSLILRDENTDSDGLCDDARVFYLADANYNVTALVDTNGDVLERYLYTPYGVVTILDADFTDDADGVSDYDNTTLYTGREYDPETGLYYYRARYYHAELGKFIGRDPIVYRAADVNLYRYVGNDPTSTFDPSGTAPVNCAAKFRECLGWCGEVIEQCRFRAHLVCLSAGAILVRNNPAAAETFAIWLAGCEAIFFAGCEADDRVRVNCCQAAFKCCQQNKKWPGFFWRLAHGCPIGIEI